MPVFYAPDFEVGHTLPPDESKHAIRVLRMREGDALEVVDGKGNRYTGNVAIADQKGLQVDVSEAVNEPPRDRYLHLAIAPTKNRDRIEWLIEKAVEIGVEKITLLDTEHGERAKINTERLQRIMVAAMKQSKRSHLPQLSELTGTERFWPQAKEKEKYIAHCIGGNKTYVNDIEGRECVIAIGPEGDFSDKEIDNALSGGWVPLDLGDMRLRTETAGVFVCAAIALKP